MSATSLAIIAFACLGSVFALYAYHVETQLANPGYVPSCDAYGYSCSKVFTHPGGHLLSFLGLVPRHHALDFSSALLGFLFYFFTIIMALVPTEIGDAHEQRARRMIKSVVQFCSSMFSGFITVFMSYVMITMVKETCIVCTSMYACNVAILVLSTLEFVRAWILGSKATMEKKGI